MRMIIKAPGIMTGRTDRTADGACLSVGNQGQIRGAGMTGRTCVMLDVVSCIGKQRIGYCCGMTVKTGGLGVYKVARIMINVMGEQVQGTGAVIYSAVTTRTVAAAGTAGGQCYQAVVVTSRIRMTGGTGVMDRVVRRIYGETGSNCCVMAGVAVAGNRKRHTTGGNMVDGVSTRIGIMTALAVARSG